MFGYSIDPKHFPLNQTTPTFDVAFNAGCISFIKSKKLYVAEVAKVTIGDFIVAQDIYRLLEAIRASATTEISQEAAGDWLLYDCGEVEGKLGTEDEDENTPAEAAIFSLLQEIRSAVERWADANDLQPKFTCPIMEPTFFERGEIVAGMQKYFAEEH